MSLKKTDLAKQMALKLDGKRKAAQIPDRFGKQSAAVNKAAKVEAPAAAAPKLVPVTCRLPAELVQRLRTAALAHPGGIHGLMSEAASQWLAADQPAPAPKAPAAKKTTKKASE